MNVAMKYQATEIDYAIDQLKPGLKSMAEYFFCYLKSALVICAYRRVHNAHTLCLLHTQGHAAAHKHAKYEKWKDYKVKDY